MRNFQENLNTYVDLLDAGTSLSDILLNIKEDVLETAIQVAKDSRIIYTENPSPEIIAHNTAAMQIAKELQKLI